MGTGIQGTWLGPRTRSLNELIEEVSEFVELPDSPRGRARAHAALRAAVRRMNMREWWWTRVYHDITLLTSEFEYAIPADYKRTISGRAMNDTSDPEQDTQRWVYHDPEKFDGQLRGNWSRDQHIFTVRNPLFRRLLSFPSTATAPQSRFNYFRHHYWRTMTIPEALSDSIFAPSSAEDFIVTYAEYRLARLYDQKRAGEARSAYREAWAELRRDQKEQHTMSSKRGA